MSSPAANSSRGNRQRARRAGGIARTVNAGFAHHQAGRLGRAEALYRKALAKDPGHAEALHLLGLIAYQHGKVDRAIELIGRALPALHDMSEAHLNLGNALREVGRLTEAADSYRRAIALDPDYGMAHSNLARALNDQGLFEAGLESARRAIELMPDFLGAQLNSAAALLGLVRLAEAEAPLRRALDLMPARAETHRYLAAVLVRLGRLDDAVASYRRAAALEPDHPETHYHLGKALHLQNRLDEAVSSYRRALVLEPSYTEAHHDLGVALEKQGRLDEAVKSYRQALGLSPDRAEVYYNLGNILSASRRFDEAVECYRQAIQLKPEVAEVHNNLGNLLKETGELDEAVASFERALALAPDYAPVHNGLGNVLLAQYRRDEAVASYRRALALQPDFAIAHYNLAVALIVQDRLSEAIASLRRAMELEPGNVEALATWFELIQRICDWSGYRKNEASVRNALVRQPAISTAFVMLWLSSTPQERFKCARRVAAKIAVSKSTMLPHPRPRPSERIRLGYLSADFRRHPVAYLIAELIERHDRQRFAVVGYSWGPADSSAMRARFTAGFDRFVDIDRMPHRHAAELIHADATDILIDLSGYTGHARPAILAPRPAPVQVNYLGYPGTMGADFIDYIIVDRFLVPPDQQPFYTERLVHLPHCYQPSDTTRETAEPAPSRAECGLPEVGFLFCSFNNSYKITPTVFDIWMNLLRTVPDSVLWLSESNALVKDNLRREAVSRGVAPGRLVFAPPVPMPDYLARLGLADLFLDTLPYNAGATANDALWVGLPVLTCAGWTYTGRMAGALLTAIVLPELITTSLEEYSALALRLATEPDRLAGVRQKLQRNRSTMPFFDIARFTHEIEAAYMRMWEIWRAGRPPAAFLVPPSAGAAG
jgi:predicted O-linked N-acetylglucosamine transferase (SPINDLY family)